MRESLKISINFTVHGTIHSPAITNLTNYKMKQTLIPAMLMLLLSISAFGQGENRNFYQIKVFRYQEDHQRERLEKYFEKAYLPALHRAGIEKVGVFKPIEGKNEETRYVMVFIPLESMDQFLAMDQLLAADGIYLEAGKDYLDAAHDQPPYTRIESTLLRAFSGFPKLGEPVQEGARKNRVYELRSYQASTEKLYERKVEMFNEGESDLFVRLGFQPLFFGEVLSSTHMPHLMYMTTFENEASQEEKWDAFRVHPDWIGMKDLERYLNTVSHIDRYLLYPAEYSDL